MHLDAIVWAVLIVDALGCLWFARMSLTTGASNESVLLKLGSCLLFLVPVLIMGYALAD
jgi:hypothetical protein